MKPIITRIILKAMLLGLGAQCEKIALEPEEELPVLSGADTFFNQAYRMLYTAVTVTLPESGGNLDTVRVEMFLVSADTSADTAAVDTPLVSYNLNDSANFGDILPEDGVYSRAFASTLPSGTVGTARLVYYAQVSGILYSLDDSVDIYLPLLSNPRSEIDKLSNEMFAAVKVNLAESDPEPDSVWVELYPASADLIDTLGSSGLLLSVPLEDLGAGGDSVRADSIYSGRFDSPLSLGTIGSIRFFYLTLFDGRLHSATDTLILVNRAPVIDSVSAADTLNLPPDTFFTLDTLRVTVSDPDGLGDVKEVSFTTLKPDGTISTGCQPCYLKDDGEIQANGDHTAGDGIYSMIITLASTNATGYYEYRFTAKDYSNAVSDTSRHRVLVQ